MTGFKLFEVWGTNLSEQAYQFKAGSMGTGFVFKIVDYQTEQSAEHVCKMAMDIIEDANQRFSTYIENSELSQINRGEITIEQASEIQKEIWQQARDWKGKTAGFFDAESPEGLIDPSGIVKTWAAQNAANFLHANGYREFTLNAGGDVLLSENLNSPLLSRVGLSNLQSIASENAFINMVIDLTDSKLRAVATSGSSERGEHIWRKDSSFVQATVIAEDLVTADVWATALIAGGDEAMKILPKEIVAMAVTNQGEIRTTAGFYPLLGRI